MTMHLLPIYFTTTKHSRKRKRKFSQKQQKAQQEHEKFLKKMGVNNVDVSGKATERIANPSYAGSNPVIHSIPTSDIIPDNGNKKDTQKYTGTNILGIATMHKSNMVPITNKQAAKDIAKMRRQ